MPLALHPHCLCVNTGCDGAAWCVGPLRPTFNTTGRRMARLPGRDLLDLETKPGQRAARLVNKPLSKQACVLQMGLGDGASGEQR